jgi:hypothetical protein
MIFASPVSKFNTALPKLVNRQPLGTIHREKPKKFSPAGASVNLRKRVDVLRVMMIQISRPEFANTTARYTEKGGDPINERWTRFPPLEDQRKATDVMLRDWAGEGVDVDTILSNTVHMAPFYSFSLCVYCGEVVTITSVSSWIIHFAKMHKRLFSSHLSCPSCVGIKVQAKFIIIPFKLSFSNLYFTLFKSKFQ